MRLEGKEYVVQGRRRHALPVQRLTRCAPALASPCVRCWRCAALRGAGAPRIAAPKVDRRRRARSIACRTRRADSRVTRRRSPIRTRARSPSTRSTPTLRDRRRSRRRRRRWPRPCALPAERRRARRRWRRGPASPRSLRAAIAAMRARRTRRATAHARRFATRSTGTATLDGGLAVPFSRSGELSWRAARGGAMTTLTFTKMQGLGNDFVVSTASRQRVRRSTPAQIRALADRRFGVGCDQVLVVEPPHARRRRLPLPDLQRRRRRGRAVRQRRALLRRVRPRRTGSPTSARSASRRPAASSCRRSRTTAR